jgi:hypothetical protein
MSVAMDTSALMMPVECNVRVFDELERLLGGVDLLVPQAVVSELEKLASGNGEEAKAASVGIDLARERCAVTVTDESYADDALVELATRETVEYVVTNDQPLQTRLLERETPVIGIRGQNKLAITQP